MKTAIVVVRSLLGLLLLFASVTYFLNLIPQPELRGNMKLFNDGLNASGYLVPLLKSVELICGILFLSGRFVPLATVLIFPITVNVVFVHSVLDPAGLPVALFLLASNLFLAYACRSHYRPLFSAKIQRS